jgi:hypothetical protein
MTAKRCGIALGTIMAERALIDKNTNQKRRVGDRD